MFWSEPNLRKRRTRQHVIADQSAIYFERFAVDEGHTVERWRYDYGYDLNLITYDEQGYVEPGYISIQLKATESLKTAANCCILDLDVRDCRLWLLEAMPVVLVLFDAMRRKAYWLHIQEYFRQHPTAGGRRLARTIRVRVPMRQTLNRRAISIMREIKQQRLLKLKGIIHG